MRKIIIISLAVFCCIQALSAETARDEFAAGCDFYKKAEYEKALEKFKPLEKDYPTANLLYDTGNTYYRLGKIGFARLYYEKARKKSLFDDDVNSNIKFLSGLINDADNAQGFFTNIRTDIAKLLFSSAVLIFIIVISIKLINPKKNVFWPLVVSGLLLVAFSALYFVKHNQQNRTDAVVINGNSEIRSGPDNSFKVNFTLPEGKKIIVFDRSGEWAEIGVKSLGLRGWIEIRNIEIVN